MRYVDENNQTIENPDLEKGRLEADKLFVQHHDRVEPVEGEYHYRVIAEYPNGGKDVEKVWDIAPVPEQEAWDEYEDVLRYIAYTPEELAEMEKENTLPTIEELAAENKKLSSQLEAAIQANANLEDCLVEMAEIVYG